MTVYLFLLNGWWIWIEISQQNSFFFFSLLVSICIYLLLLWNRACSTTTGYENLFTFFVVCSNILLLHVQLKWMNGIEVLFIQYYNVIYHWFAYLIIHYKLKWNDWNVNIVLANQKWSHDIRRVFKPVTHLFLIFPISLAICFTIFFELKNCFLRATFNITTSLFRFYHDSWTSWTSSTETLNATSKPVSHQNQQTLLHSLMTRRRQLNHFFKTIFKNSSINCY